MNDFKIKSEDIYRLTEGGKLVILYYYPQAQAGFNGRKNFKLRSDDKNPSATVYQSRDGSWLLQDKGGSDNQAYNAISLVMKEENLKYPQAIEWIASKFAPELLEDRSSGRGLGPEAGCEEAEAQDTITVQYRPSGEFTEHELEVLGHMVHEPDGPDHPFITPEDCEDLCLKPLDSYITARNEKGKSWRWIANDGFPMYAYDYETYGKIYQPFHQKYRFLWFGSKQDKQDNPFSGEREFMSRWQGLAKGTWSPELRISDENGKEQVTDNKWDKLIICSGPSDALNIHHAGYHVCWPNSETADITEYQMKRLEKMAKEIYICYDIDETGLRNMYQIALQYIGIKIIRLPEELKQKRARNGKPCKDAKDFFSYYRKPEIQNPVRLFSDLVKLSGGLQFWTEHRKKSDDGKSYVSTFDINNAQLYAFLQASGFYTINSSEYREGYTFCRVQGNVVRLIDKESIQSECVLYLQEYLRTHPTQYSQGLENTIYRTRQISASNLTMLRRINPDFNAFTEDWDWFFFRNRIIRVGAEGIETVRPEDCPYMVYEKKQIDCDFTPEEAFFDIRLTPEYEDLRRQLRECAPRSPQYYALQRHMDTMDPMRKYTLEIKKWGSTYMQYIYNTGRTYWRKEEEGYSLTETERLEVERNFLAKVLALGYLLSKHKNSGQPYAVYAMEMTQGEDGEHLGGTGKSLYLKSIEKMRCQHYVDAQKIQEDRIQFMLQGVIRGVTDMVFMDDVNHRIDLHLFMNMITGKMVVDVKHASPFTLDFLESPKVAFTSNHAVSGFDDSLNRRIWFAAFSDYYHSDSELRGLKLRSPRSEFGKDLIDQYTPEEMNHFYTFMLNCISVWHKIHERVQPPMGDIVKRTIVRSIGEDFLWWCQEWFGPERLNTVVEMNEAYEACKSALSKRASDFMNKRRFKERLKLFCKYMGYTYNPTKALKTPTERERDRIQFKVGNEVRYGFYIETDGDPGIQGDSAGQTGGGAGSQYSDDQPPF